MKFYLIDDDQNVINILKLIIKDRGLGELCGTCTNAADALEDLKYIQPDIVIVDLLMPVMDGITFVRQAREIVADTAFIMLSQVSSKDMVSAAYESGIEFFIQKPVNSIEVESVIQKVRQNLSMKRTMSKMQNLFLEEMKEADTGNTDSSSAEPTHLVKAKDILQKLGIIGEIGANDILKVLDFLITHLDSENNLTLTELCSQFSDNPKSMEQRIRRTANTALINLANLGIEDYSNDTFIEYSNTLFNFEQVRREMDYIRGKADKGGNVKIRNFLNALVSYCYK